jgi:hypothetical protein
MTKDEINEFIKDGFGDLPSFKEIQSGIIGESKIDKYKEEDFVIKSLFQGRSASWILQTLSDKHKENFYKNDLDAFVRKNASLIKKSSHGKSIAARRFFEARADVEEKMAHLIIFTESLVKKYDEKEDAQATVAALNILNKTLMNYSKLAGFLKEEEPKEVKNIINVISDKKARLASEVIGADFKMVEDSSCDDDED